uniref:Cytochrome c oxidase subunit 2 n=2 Tax=Wasmannia auropunctata TaxID=64793 RepID=A0A191TFU1_WASAN|nr:cytochrome c oxidase subunit II [Wasmannia auropunctata]ANI87502.1 cytochrome c oxidase subunit II [Wasmannia auropunctata]
MNTWLISLQNSNTPIYDMMIFFHDFMMIILTFITMIIMFIMAMMFSNKLTNRYLLQGHTMELLWTILPMFTLILIAIPSLKILYLTDEIHNNKLSIKAIGHQWYWSYEYSDFKNIEFDSFMIPTNQLMNNEFRLLEVDNRCILPFNYPLRILTTSLDVIHAWTVPSLGIKMDSTPGRLNQTYLTMMRPGLYFGQCSEICGMNHSFMPIVIESTNLMNFKNWLMSFK